MFIKFKSLIIVFLYYLHVYVLPLLIKLLIKPLIKLFVKKPLPDVIFLNHTHT